MQAKRIQVQEANNGVGGAVNVSLAVPTEPREEVNFHNIWGSVSVEPENTDANAQGTWLLFILRENATQPVFTDVITDNETNNAVIIACGVWSASNQTPFNITIHPSTSRTLQAGDRLFLQSVVTGITAGNASNRVMLCAHVTRKCLSCMQSQRCY